jgi:hypothetical protein
MRFGSCCAIAAAEILAAAPVFRQVVRAFLLSSVDYSQVDFAFGCSQVRDGCKRCAARLLCCYLRLVATADATIARRRRSQAIVKMAVRIAHFESIAGVGGFQLSMTTIITTRNFC